MAKTKRGDDKKRIRSSNYSTEDTRSLVDLACARRNIVESKKTDAVSTDEKTLTWKKICKDYNAVTVNHRTPEQLRQKYDSLKKAARRYAATKHQMRIQTGGGPPEQPPVDTILEKIIEIKKLSSEGHSSSFDSDAMFTHEGREMGDGDGVRVDDDDNESDTAIDDSCVVDLGNVTVLFAQEDSERNDHEVEHVSWGKYNPKILKTPLNSALQKVLNVQEPKELPVAAPVPLQETATTTTNCSNMIHTSAVSNKSNVKRIGTKKPPLSASAQKLEPWISLKKELVQLQINQMKEKHVASEQREEELFALKKRELQLSIEIKEETLKKMRMTP